MIPGRWCQVPGAARPSLCSPLRAFVGSSDKLVRGAGRRPPPNRLSQKGEENERLGVEGGGAPVPAALWERGGRGRPRPTGPKGVHPPRTLRRFSVPWAPEEPDPWAQRTPGPMPKKRRIWGEVWGTPPPPLLPSHLTHHRLSPHLLHARHSGPRPPPRLSPLSLPGSRLDIVNDSHSTEEDTEDQRGSLVNSKLRAACPNSITESSFLHCISLRSHPQSHSV